MSLNYHKICHVTLIHGLPERTKDVVIRRFGLRGERETLEAIGATYGITRERVRQIEEDGLKQVRDRLEDAGCKKAFQYFASELKKNGSLKREDLLLAQLGGQKFQNHVFFLLTLGGSFERINEDRDIHVLWTIDRNFLNRAKKSINFFVSTLKKKNQPMSLLPNTPSSHVEISKKILKGPDGSYGLKDWPEVNPKGIKDKAYLVLRKEKKPVHFVQVASLMSGLTEPFAQKNVLPQTVHNELIKDQRFVLVGRGTYALTEWGYEPGVVKDVIKKVLKESKKPLAKEEVVVRVSAQRLVKENTILLNLQNKSIFLKDSKDRYFVKEV